MLAGLTQEHQSFERAVDHLLLTEGVTLSQHLHGVAFCAPILAPAVEDGCLAKSWRCLASSCQALLKYMRAQHPVVAFLLVLGSSVLRYLRKHCFGMSVNTRVFSCICGPMGLPSLSAVEHWNTSFSRSKGVVRGIWAGGCIVARCGFCFQALVEVCQGAVTALLVQLLHLFHRPRPQLQGHIVRDNAEALLRLAQFPCGV